MIDLASFRLKVDKTQVDQATTSLKEMGETVPGVSKGVDVLTDTFDKLKNPLTAAITLFATAAAGAMKLGFDAIDAADSLDKFSAASGRATEEMQVIQQIVDKAGGNIDTVMSALDKLGTKLVDLSEDQASALEHFGVAIRDMNGELKSSEQVAMDVAKAYLESTRSTSDQAAASEILGKSYRDVVLSLNDLTNKEKEYQTLQATGAIASQELIDASVHYNDAMSDNAKILEGVGNYVASAFLPVLGGVAEQLFSSATNGGLLNYALDALGKALQVVAGVLRVVATGFVGLDTGVQLASKSITLIIDLMSALGSWDSEAASKAWKKYVDDVIKTSTSAKTALDTIWSSIDEKGPGKEGSTGGRNRGEWAPTSPTKTATPKQSEAEKEADRQLKALESLIAAQDEKNARTELEISLIGKTTEEQTRLRAEYEKSVLARRLEKQGFDTSTAAAQSYLDRIVELEMTKQKTASDAAYLEKLKGEAEALRDAIDPLNKYRKQMETVEELEKRQLITADEKLEMLWKINEEMDKVMDKSKKTAKDQESMWEKLESAVDGYTRSMADAFVNFAFTGKASFGDFVSSVMQDIARMFANDAFKDLLKMGKGMFNDAGGFSGVASGIGSWVSSIFSANGNVFSNGNLQPFATGGVIDSPIKFPLANGVGIAGEAGEEAIMPLRRGTNGRLGVEMVGTGQNTTNNIVTVENINVSVREQDQGDGKRVGREVADQIKSIVLQTLNTERRSGNSLNPISMRG